MAQKVEVHSFQSQLTGTFYVVIFKFYVKDAKKGNGLKFNTINYPSCVKSERFITSLQEE